MPEEDIVTDPDQNIDTTATVVDEAYMERYTNDELAYKAWCGTDLAKDVLFDEEADEDCLTDAKFEVACADIALRVLVRRLIGMKPEDIRQALFQRLMASTEMRPDKDQFAAWETPQ